MLAPVHDNDLLDDTEAETQRLAYNAAFEELGLSWQWDPLTFACLPQRGPRGVRAYLEQEQPHLLRAYEAEFLVNAIETTRERCQSTLSARRGALAPRV